MFRARMSDKMMDDIREAALDLRMSQQEIVRSAVQVWLDELDRVQGVTPTLGHRVLEPQVKVASRPAPAKRKAKRVTKPEADPTQRDGRSVEDVALRNLRKHVEARERDRELSDS